MNRGTKRSGQSNQGRIERIALVALVQDAYEQFCELMAQPHKSPQARKAIAAAKERLTALNRVLALVALESSMATA